MKRNSPAKAGLVLFAAALLAAGLTAFSCSGRGASVSQGGEGPLLAESSASFKPDAQPGWKAILSFFGTEIPVEVEEKRSGAFVTLRLLSFGQEIEVERYRSTPDNFELVQMAGESFDPPLPLLKFPVHAGKQLPWKGKLIIGELGRDAEASIEARKEPFKAKGFEGVESLKITVELKIDGGAPTPAVRTLEFWFVESKGLLKREIDKGSSRIPVPATDSAETRG